MFHQNFHHKDTEDTEKKFLMRKARNHLFFLRVLLVSVVNPYPAMC